MSYMLQTYSVLLCFAAVVAVVLASRAYGRMVGVFAAATCGVSVALVMPPTFSFQVNGFMDQLALALYGAVSVLVVARFPVWRNVTGAEDLGPRTEERPRIRLSQLVPAVEGVEVFVADLAIACDAQCARQELEQIFRLALAQSDVEKISVYGGRWPGVDRIWVAARYRHLPDEPCLLMSSGDNGYERVYEISLPNQGQ